MHLTADVYRISGSAAKHSMWVYRFIWCFWFSQTFLVSLLFCFILYWCQQSRAVSPSRVAPISAPHLCRMQRPPQPLFSISDQTSPLLFFMPFSRDRNTSQTLLLWASTPPHQFTNWYRNGGVHFSPGPHAPENSAEAGCCQQPFCIIPVNAWKSTHHTRQCALLFPPLFYTVTPHYNSCRSSCKNQH